MAYIERFFSESRASGSADLARVADAVALHGSTHLKRLVPVRMFTSFDCVFSGVAGGGSAT